MKMTVYRWMAALLVLTGLLHTAGCEENFIGRQYDTDEEYMQIYDYVKQCPELSIYREICDYSGFYSQISTAGTYTVFAAVDSAWTSLFKELKIEGYKEKSPEYWLMYMEFAAIEKQIHTNSLNGGKMTEHTILDKNYFLSVDVTSYTAIKLNNRAVITEYNIELKNGYLNLTDAVLVPPVSPVYDMLKDDGRFGTMLSLFEENGLKPYLTDSLVTVFVEPDNLFESSGFKPETLSPDSLRKWLEYHIFPGQRYFVNDLDGRMLQPLYAGDVVTFNKKKKSGDGFGSVFANQAFRISGRTDRNALNGVVHEMGNVLEIADHTAGIIETNLYGADNDRKDYRQNVFSQEPAVVKEHFGYNSYHQRVMDEPQPPMCFFVSSQNGDSFRVRIADVAKGNYQVRLIYNRAYVPTLRLVFNGVTIRSGINMGSPDGSFTEYTSLNYKNCGTVEIGSRGNVELQFMLDENSCLLMDRVDLIPVISF